MSLAAPAPSRPARPRRAAAEAPAKPRRASTRATLARPRAGRSPVGAGVLWVLVIAALLGGMVAVNVAALRNSIEAGRLSGQVASLRAENQSLQSHVAEMSGIGRISSLARQLGMVPTQPTEVIYLRLHPGQHRPAATTTAPSRLPKGPAQREPRRQRTP
jgi:cell division protein FtsL